MKNFYLTCLALGLSALAANAEAVTGATYYVRGGYNGWGTGTAMTEISSGVYNLKLDQFYGNFKIATDNWSQEWASSDGSAIVPNTPYTNIQIGGKDMKMTVDKLTNVSITLDTNVPSLLIEGTEQAETNFTIYIAGQWNNWKDNTTDNPDHAIINTEKDGNIAVIKVNKYDGIYGFKIVVNGSWLGNARKFYMGREYVVDSEVDNMSLPAECEGKAVTFTYNVTDKTLKATVDYDVTYEVSLVGSFNKWDANANKTVANEEGVCVWNIPNYTDVEGQGTGFKIVQGKWMGNGQMLELGKAYVINSEVDNCLLPEDCQGKDLTFAYDLKNDELVVTDSSITGITEVGVDNAPAVYYNLQGVRVDNPQKGIFIRVAGVKAQKVMF